MNEQMLKRLQIALILLLLSLSAVCLYAAKKLFVPPADIQYRAQSQLDLRLYENCTQSSSRLGFIQDPLSTRDNIVFLGSLSRSQNAPVETAAKASLLIRECAGYTLKEFCMGQDCKNDVDLILEKRVR